MTNLVHDYTDNKERPWHSYGFRQMSQPPNSLQETFVSNFLPPSGEMLVSLPKLLRPSQDSEEIANVLIEVILPVLYLVS